MPKPVLAYCLEYPLAMRGGVSVLVEVLIEKMREHFQIVLLSPDTQDSLASHPLAGSIARHIRWDTIANPPSGTYKRESRRATQELLDARVAIAHFHCGGVYGWGNRLPFASLPAQVARHGAKVFWTDHSVVSPFVGYCGGNKPSWLKWLMFLPAWFGKIHQLSACSAEIAVSDAGMRQLQKWYFPQRYKIHRIYHSRLEEAEVGSQRAEVESHKSEVSSLASDLPSPISHLRSPAVLSVGHIAFRKGQHLLAEAFARIAKDFPEWQLQVVGHDAGDGCWQQIERTVSAHKMEDRIHLLGSRDDAGALMEQAGVFVQPALFEGLPLALQEALFRGCPCVGSNIDGNTELIEPQKNGLLFSSGDINDLAHNLSLMMADPALRKSFAIRSRESIIARGMTAERMAEEHMRFYAEIQK
jgi:glycosyltransferase involved in cell wall biosynthesis